MLKVGTASRTYHMKRMHPFTIPNFVREAREGMQEPAVYSLDELPAQVLSDLCDEFRASVFEKARVPDPQNSATAACLALEKR